MKNERPVASLSLDLDNKWSYLKTHGDPGWKSFPSYLDILVPRVLRFLEERQLKITFFIVGQDAALPENRKALAAIADAGHEIGNHSFNHEPWLHLYSEQQIEAELASAEEQIKEATGQRPIGFRGPGFSLSEAVLNVLKRRGYQYDASTLPTFLGPLARAYYFATTKLSAEQKRERALLFGSPREAFRSIKPYRWRLGAGELTEIPVTTIPLLRVPFHLSYVLYLSRVSPTLALEYFRLALTLCRLTATSPSVLLHPLDFLGCDDVEELSFFPGMNIPSERKIALVSRTLGLLSGRFRVVSVGEHATEVGKMSATRLVIPRFQNPGEGLTEALTE